jgi:hypothetical protein
MASSGSFGAGLAAAVVVGGGFLAHNAGVFTRSADDLLVAAKNTQGAYSALRDIRSGSYVRVQATDFFCEAVASIHVDGTLPQQATDLHAYIDARTGQTDSAEEYLDGKADQLETAVAIAETNPRAAARYAQACARL